jgi:hypothetical protein
MSKEKKRQNRYFVQFLRRWKFSENQLKTISVGKGHVTLILLWIDVEIREYILLWSLARRKLGDRDRPERDRFDWEPPLIMLVVINWDGDPESIRSLLFVSFISDEPAESTKRSRSKLSSSTPFPNHRPHENLFSF